MELELRYFMSREFQGHWERINVDLLVGLDEFRHQWGAPVRVSPAPGAIARFDGAGGTSQHNVDRWGETRAVDVMPYGITSRIDFLRAVDIARGVGFTGIGVYPDWKPLPGLHLDWRDDRTAGDPAMWGAYRPADGGPQRYVSVAAALNQGEAHGVLV